MLPARTLVLAVVLAFVGLLSPAGPAPAIPVVEVRSTAAYDAGLSQRDCDLLGRQFRRGLGCSRSRCTDGAVPFRRTYGAEACALRGQPRGFGFVATVDLRQCEALGRRWVEAVNYCASLPDRSVTALHGAPQCTPPASVYVPLREEEGFYDECLTPERVDELSELANASGTTLPHQVALRSSLQCAHRPASAFVDGQCVRDASAVPTGGGTLIVGDSITWRGGDELTLLEPRWTIDAEPARPATELAARLADSRSRRGDPSGLVVELGTVPAPGFSRRDLTAAVRTLPRTTQVMLVLPYVEVRTEPTVVVSPQSRRVGGWMRALARSRARTCVADWPAYVRAHPGTLQDGVHAGRDAEGRWARWVRHAWKGC